MGYNSDIFGFFTEIDIPKRGTILDLGSQDLTLRTSTDLTEVNQFVQKYGGAPLALELPCMLEAGNVWKAAGFSYTCVDVDRRPGTTFLDLQKLEFPQHMKAKFDVVLNCGTTEHLANPVGGFAFVHFACKASGIMLHDVPLFGFGNHGLTSPTPKFWHQMRIVNGYETIRCKVRVSNEADSDPGNFFVAGLEYIEGLEAITGISSLIRAVFRKAADDCFFIPPSDAVGKSSDIKLSIGSLSPFVRAGTCTIREARIAIVASVTRLSIAYRSPLHRRIVRRVVTMVSSRLA